MDAVIVDAVRTATGRRNGALSGWHPADLAAACLVALAGRNGLDPALVNEVVLGCVTQIGAQSMNVGRSAVLAAGWPDSVPATTVDRQGAAGLAALQFAAHGVASGAWDVAVAGGVEVTSLVPTGAAMGRGYGRPFGPGVTARYAERGGLVPEGVAAEGLAERWGLERDDLDRWALRSQQRAARAVAEGRFTAEVVAVAARSRAATAATGAAAGEGGAPGAGRPPLATGGPVLVDEGIQPVGAEALADLRPLFQPGGRVTAGNSAQLGDGASAVLVASEAAAARLGWRPRARVLATAGAGVDPLGMLDGAIPAGRRALEVAGLGVGELDRVEVHETFAPVVLGWGRALGTELDRVNVNGGAIALGDALGSSGTRELATLVHELERCGGRYGLVAAGGGGGVGSAVLIERLS